MLQFIKFNIVGVINTLVDMMVFFLLTELLGVYFLIAQVFSYSCGTLNSYLLNKYWTFASKTKVNAGEVLRFIAVNLVSLGVSMVVLYICKSNFHLTSLTSKLIATVFSVMINYIGNRIFVF